MYVFRESTDSVQCRAPTWGQAWGWLRQKLIPHWHASGPVVKVQKAGTQTSYSPLKAERERFGALQSPNVKIQSLKKKALLIIEPVSEDLVLTFFDNTIVINNYFPESGQKSN